MGKGSEKDIIITGSKGKGGGGSYRTPVEQPDTLQSTQIVTIVDAISEGPIEGLVDGDKGIALNYTPLRTPEGTLTYQNVSWDSRLGTPDQEAYTDIAGAEAEQSVGVEVTNLFPKKVGPAPGSVTRTLNNTNCTHVRITLMVQGLYEQKMSGDNVGDTVAASVSYRIQIRNNLGVIIADTSETKTDKTTSSAQWYLKFALDRNGPWTITVSKTSEDSDKSNIKTDLYWSSYTEIIGYPLVYPHTATVLLRGSAETFGGSVPSRAYHVKGLRIEVPSNYDPETRAYTGIWDGTFKTAWTDNPAWILRDLIQSNRYGLRKFFPPARQGQDLIDKWTLYQLAQYCDQLVPDGENGSEPRYTFNAQIMGSGEAREVIQSIASVFHGMTYWSSGMIFARADMPADPVKLISQANVIDGMLTYSTGSAQERHSVALVTWYDPDDYGRARVEPVYDWDAYQRYGYRPVQVTAYGCTSRGQAYRQGLWTLLTEDEQWQCSVEVGLDCYDLLPGDFVKVADPTAMGVRYTGRIKSVSNDITFVLDAPVTLDANETYTLSLTMPDGTIETRDITTRGTTDTVVVRSAFSALPVEWGVWMISGSDAAPRLFAVRSITEKGGDSTALELSLREVHLTKYAQLEGELILPETPGRISKRSLGVPSGLNVAETTYSSNGFPVQRLTFSWAANGDAETALYEPQYKAPNGQWTNFQPQKLFSVEVPVAAAGEYLFRVRSVATDGRVSSWAEISHTSTGTTTLPKPVTNLHAQGGQYSVLVSWTLPQDALAGYYEVWYSDDDSVGNAQLVAKIYADNFTVSGLDASTPYWFWVRSVSITGLPGEMVGPVGGVTEAVRPPDIPDGTITESKLESLLQTKLNTLDDVVGQVQPLSEKLEMAVPAIEAITPFMTITLPKMEKAEELLAKTVAANAVDVFNDRKTAEQGFADVSQRISTEVSTLNGSIASVETDVLTKYNEHSALITSAQTAISNEAEARAAGDLTLQATLQGEIDTNTAAIAQTQEAVSSISGSHATEMRTVYARIAENAEAAALDSVDVFNAQAKENRRIALVQQTIDTSVDEINGSIAMLRTDIISKYDAAAARITETQQTIANNQSAQASVNQTMQSQIAENASAIQTNAETITTNQTAQASVNQTLQSQITANAGNIATNASAIQTNAQTITNNQNTQASVNQSLQSQITTNAGNITANASAISRNAQTIATNQSTQANVNTSMRSAIQTNAGNIATNTSNIADNAAAIATNTAAISQNAQTIANNKAAQTNINTSMQSAIQTNAANITSNTTAIQTNAAAISQNAQTIASNQSTQASVNTTLQSRLSALDAPATATSPGGLVTQHTATLTQQAQTLTSLDGTVSALYTLRTDVNGHISGFGLSNDGERSDFVILADRFIIAGPNGATTRVFTVDADSGAIVINGNLFVDSAGKANSGWIKGDMIYAGSVIELADGAIVLDGQNGTVSVFDPANKTNGNFIEITSGHLRLYKHSQLCRTLSAVETGSCANGVSVTLSKTYSSPPSISISPQSIQTYNPNLSTQNQTLKISATAPVHLGNGRYRFTPQIALVSESGAVPISPLPGRLDSSSSLGPTNEAIAAFRREYSSGTTYDFPQTHMTDSAATPAGIIGVTVSVRFYVPSAVESIVFESGAGGYNEFRARAGTNNKWRIAYRLQGQSGWSYSAYSSTITNPPDGESIYEDSMTISLPEGTYEIAAEFNSTLSGQFKSNQPVRDIPTFQESWFEISSITGTKNGATQLATGTVNYIAIGE